MGKNSCICQAQKLKLNIYNSEEFESLKRNEDEGEKKPVEINHHGRYGEVHLELTMLILTLKVFKEAVNDYNFLGRVIQKQGQVYMQSQLCREDLSMEDILFLDRILGCFPK